MSVVGEFLIMCVTNTLVEDITKNIFLIKVLWMQENWKIWLLKPISFEIEEEENDSQSDEDDENEDQGDDFFFSENERHNLVLRRALQIHVMVEGALAQRENVFMIKCKVNGDVYDLLLIVVVKLT